MPPEPSERPSSKRGGGSQGRLSTSTGTELDENVKAISTRALQYESQMLDLNNKLTENLSNFRAIDSLLQEALAGLRRNADRADRALTVHVPRIKDELDESLIALQELSTTLPNIQSRVADIRLVYDSGRQKARDLVTDLEWLNKDFRERWRAIIFTSSSPVSWRWKAIMRVIFAVCFITFTWVAWIALGGAYRAHRQRLVWGERLMS
ncbi:hypothetical protein BV22DRAFT_1033297 [Leucogyrophana mollusca]|uniref:Uncharacterized protein n=1 Tax=Leucogyrophana mollusca TaxID=85980 RepID=A0ACB8BKJ5_9AGAM|nr:hypothetical protein BV22DRAFT_1033297 [Leucogyrophana mollusca]